MSPEGADQDLVTLLSLFNYRDLAQAIARSLSDDQALAFLYELDEAMGSWDFTLAAVDQLAGSARSFINDTTTTSDLAVVERVAEFTRQAGLIPHIEQGQQVMGVWTDPHAQHAALTIGDLRQLVELATITAVKYANKETEVQD